MTLTQNARDQGSVPHWGTEFFLVRKSPLIWPTVTFSDQCDLWDQNIRGCFLPGGVNVTVVRCLDGLVVMILSRNARDLGLITQNFFALLILTNSTQCFITKYCFCLRCIVMLRLHVQSMPPFLYRLKLASVQTLWCCLHLTLKRSQVPLTKTDDTYKRGLISMNGRTHLRTGHSGKIPDNSSSVSSFRPAFHKLQTQE